MKLGSYSIPDIRLFPKLVDWVYEIYKTFELEPIENQEAMAKIAGHSTANSGAWISKLADMRLYGLITSRELQVTELAERLVSGTSEDKAKATKEAILNVPLWNIFYEQFGKNPPEDSFWIHLQKYTSVSNLQAQKYAEEVREAYIKDVSHIEETTSCASITELKEPIKKLDINLPPSSDVVGKIIAYGYGEIDIKDGISYEIAKSYLKIFANKLGIEE